MQAEYIIFFSRRRRFILVTSQELLPGQLNSVDAIDLTQILYYQFHHLGLSLDKQEKLIFNVAGIHLTP